MKTSSRLLRLFFFAFATMFSPAGSAQTNYTPYTVLTYAGTPGNINHQDGFSNHASFYGPGCVVIDNSNDLFVADQNNNIIRKITPDQHVTTIAGIYYTGGFILQDGTNQSARFGHPSGLAFDTNGNLYVADLDNYAIRKMTPQGTNWVVTTIAGSTNGLSGSDDGTNFDARFYFPHDVAVDLAGNVFVADELNYTIRKITPVGTNWVTTTIAGQAGVQDSVDGVNTNALFYRPWGLVVDTNDNLFVSDNDIVREISPAGTNWVTTTIAGCFTNAGIVDGTNNAALFGNGNTGVGGGLHGIGMDNSGNLFVTDTGSEMVRELRHDGTNWVVTTLAGWSGTTGFSDGVGANGRFNSPCSAAIDNFGNVFVVDYTSATIRKLLPFAVTNTLAGRGAALGTNVFFTAPVFTNAPVTYQWFFASAAMTDQTNATLELDNVQRTDSGNYFVTVTSADTNDAVKSSTAQLRVLVAPVAFAPQVLTNGAVRLEFQDADGGTPYNLGDVAVQWRTNLPTATDTNWNSLSSGFYLSNGIVVLDDTNTFNLPDVFYRVVEF